MNPLIPLLFLFSIHLQAGQVHSAAQVPWTRYLLNDTVASLSIKTDKYDALTGDNLTVVCTVIRWCLSPYVDQCSQASSVRWFTPRKLVNTDQNSPRKSITFSRQVVGTLHKANVSGEISVIQILSTLQLNEIGFIHGGYYECQSLIESQDFNLRVAENAAHRCAFGDQCDSGNCWAGACRCSGPQFSWDSGTKSCVKRVVMGGDCTSDAECQIGGGSLQVLMPISGFAQHLSPIRCLANGTSTTCQCDSSKDVRVGVAVAEVDVCLPKASLGSTCYSSAQCTGEGTFCGLNMKTLKGQGNNSPAGNSSGLVCQCADGWHPIISFVEGKLSSQPNSCSPYTRCDSSSLGFNEHYLQGGCPRNQFCRSGYCLCLPNYEFSTSGSDGSCVLQRGIDVSQSSFLEQYFWEILVCIVAVVVVVFSLAMLQVIRSKASSKRRKARGAQLPAQRISTVRMSMINRDGSNNGSGNNRI